MRTRYYKLRGWDPDTGLQTAKCLERLDMPEVKDALESLGFIKNNAG
jgi:aldehyde:ferredoxin oxidoreductase